MTERKLTKLGNSGGGKLNSKHFESDPMFTCFQITDLHFVEQFTACVSMGNRGQHWSFIRVFFYSVIRLLG